MAAASVGFVEPAAARVVIVERGEGGDDVEAALQVVGLDDPPAVLLRERAPAVGAVEQLAERLFDK